MRPPWQFPPQDYRRLAALCKEYDFIQQLWDTLSTDVAKVVDKMAVQFVTLAMELCTQTYDTTRDIKLHAHLVAELADKKCIRNPMSMRLAGALPANTTASDTGAPSHARNRAPTDYYLQCGKKRGMPFSQRTDQPFRRAQ